MPQVVRSPGQWRAELCRCENGVRDPKYLRQYATRLNLIDPRLGRWDDIVALEDYRAVSAYVGMSRFTTAERERAELLEDIRVLQPATQSLRQIRLEEEIWEN